MTLDEAIYKLGTMAVIVRIVGGDDPIRLNALVKKRWHVVALAMPGECYPPFCDDDDLLSAVLNVISQIEERRAQGRAFIEANPELRALPVVVTPTLFPSADEN